ncbi:hypothetical protein [Oceanobacillus sp. CF4.6]|uniref:hypothetical protein n=1 Tax=Oceanobacillus sp. CF4.6 TaxID=3373080 RepID=UPI003EE4FF63
MSQTEQNNQEEIKEERYQSALSKVLETISIPLGYEFKEVRSERQNKDDVWVFRYEKSNGDNNGLGGEHFSFTVNQDSYRILGTIWMDRRFVTGQQLPSSQETLQISKTFIDQTQPGLFERLENTWIRPEDTAIMVDGEKMTVTGMRCKFYAPLENRWAWVIVGPDKDIISFEQEMVWIGGRISEMWLHDSWLLKGGDSSIKSKIKGIFSKS